MKITQKIMLIIAIVLIVALAIGNLMVYVFAKNFVSDQENIQTKELVFNVRAHIETRMESYLGSVSDWGHWNEPYDYLNGEYPNFMNDNIVASTFENLNIDFLLIIDKKTGTIKEKKYYDSLNATYVPFPQSHVDSIQEIISAGNDIGDKVFIINIDNGYYYLAISNITDTNEVNESNGYLLFGKKIDDKMLNILSHETNATVHLFDPDDLSPEALASLEQSQAQEEVEYLSIPDTEKRVMENYVQFQEENSTSPAVIINIEKSRNFYYDSMSRFSFLLLAVSAMVLFSSLLVYFLLKRYITSPILRVTNEVANLSVSLEENNEDARTVKSISNDEIGTLASTINLMIEKNHVAQQSLVQSEEQFRIMFEEAPLGIGLFYFHTGKALRINRKFSEILQRTKEEFATMDWQRITHPEDMARNNALRETIKLGESDGFSMIKRYLAPDGKIIWINLTIVLLDPIGTENPRELCMIEDISERKLKEEEILYLSFNDVLTGVYNRRFFEEEKQRLDTKRQLPLSILIADLDGLKLINDGFGYSSGDLLLKEAATLLTKICRTEDIVSRIGGDEFCILLPQTDGAAAQNIVSRIHESFKNAHVMFGTTIITPSISVGYASKIDSAVSIEDVIATAEDSMRKSKLLNRKSVRSDLINSIKATMLEKSHETADHAERMATLSVAIGAAMGFSNDDLFDLELAATLHDIGKMSVDHNILSKPGKLSEEEWLVIKQHPETGYRIASSTTELVSIAEYILSHHERWDGNGYPQGLKGDQIPLISRIVSVVDSYDAMTENRPYRKALSAEDAVKEINRNSGTQFDPEVVKIFIEIIIKKEEDIKSLHK